MILSLCTVVSYKLNRLNRVKDLEASLPLCLSLADKMASSVEKKPPLAEETPTSSDDEDFEKLIDSIGGHGPFQAFIWTVGFGTKACVAGVFLFMSFAGATPDFWCTPPVSGRKNARGVTASDVFANDAVSVREEERWKRVWNLTKSDLLKACEVNSTTACSGFLFDDSMHTIVSEVGVLNLSRFFFLGGGSVFSLMQ